jgi:antitoxin component of RelBE/YafQ-DinJ toxin-antitoxin module
MTAKNLLLTFRLDQEQRQRLKARLAREGRTMSEVVTHGLRQYVQRARHFDEAPSSSGPVLPERVAGVLRELRASGRSELLSATLAALRDAGWPLRPLAEALGISKQAVQGRIRRRVPELRPVVTDLEPPPPFPHRREASANGHRPHLTIKIDHALRAAAHQAAAYEGSSLSQVVERILDRYVRHGLAGEDQPAPAPSLSAPPVPPSPVPASRPGRPGRPARSARRSR